MTESRMFFSDSVRALCIRQEWCFIPNLGEKSPAWFGSTKEKALERIKE